METILLNLLAFISKLITFLLSKQTLNEGLLVISVFKDTAISIRYDITKCIIFRLMV